MERMRTKLLSLTSQGFCNLMPTSLIFVNAMLQAHHFFLNFFSNPSEPFISPCLFKLILLPWAVSPPPSLPLQTPTQMSSVSPWKNELPVGCFQSFRGVLSSVSVWVSLSVNKCKSEARFIISDT